VIGGAAAGSNVASVRGGVEGAATGGAGGAEGGGDARSSRATVGGSATCGSVTCRASPAGSLAGSEAPPEHATVIHESSATIVPDGAWRVPDALRGRGVMPPRVIPSGVLFQIERSPKLLIAAAPSATLPA